MTLLLTTHLRPVIAFALTLSALFGVPLSTAAPPPDPEPSSATFVSPSATASPRREQQKAKGHWGEDAVGFRWLEEDSRDARWNAMDTGPFLSSALPVPGGIVNKALSIRIGEKGQAAVCFDLAQLNLACGWTGGFLAYNPARFGIISPPSIAGQIRFSNRLGPGWEDASTRYRGLHVHGQRVVLSYTVNDTQVLDSPWCEQQGESLLFTRTLQIAPTDQPLTVAVATTGTQVSLRADADSGADVGKLTQSERGVQLRIHPHDTWARIQLQLSLLPDANQPAKIDLESQSARPPEDLTMLTQPGLPRWGAPLETRGRLGRDLEAYTIDTITLPFDNPHRALLFVGGHDFFSKPGSAALCTLHGDVWLVEGLDDDLDSIRWRRYATGLFQPLGLRIVADQVYVLGRDQITRLHDLNEDGEADFYECFNGQAKTSPGGHDFSTCLESDAQGNFYYVSEQGVHRITQDGSQHHIIATGLRNPNGMSIGPDGTITVAPQEGDWTPASALFEVTEGGYYGYGGPRVAPDRPRGYDPPLCWIPRAVDNSTGGQVWIESDRWGPLRGGLINLSFGQCRMLLTLLEPRQDVLPANWPIQGGARRIAYAGPAVSPKAKYLQGGSLTFPFSFDAGVMRGRFSPHDGQLYVSGLRGWVSAAVMDGCFQRVRFTGKPVYMPRTVRTLQNGLVLSFAVALEREAAEDPGSFQIQQWNYRYGSDYGSSDYKVSDPKAEGHDDMEVHSATLLDDRTVFLETEPLRPVMQLSVNYVLTATDGTSIRDVYYHTINVVPEVAMDPSRLTRPPSSSKSTVDLAQHVQPGLKWRFESSNPVLSQAAGVDGNLRGRIDIRRSRLAALYVPATEPPTPFLPPGPFVATAEGYLEVPLRGTYTFAVEGRGDVRLRINHRDVLAGSGADLRSVARRTAKLHKGLNHLELSYQSPLQGKAAIRLLWKDETFAFEAIPPNHLFHADDDNTMSHWNELRTGRLLYASLRCHACHNDSGGKDVPPPLAANSEAQPRDGADMPEMRFDAPNLVDVGLRLKTDWIAQWLADPTPLRNHRTMPLMLDPDDPQRFARAADLAAFLATCTGNEAVVEANPEGAVTEASQAEQGGQLFEQLGCIACHRLTEVDAEDEFDRLSLARVSAKYRPAALIDFLRDPQVRFAASRMPDFRLNQDDALALAAYLYRESSGQPAGWTKDTHGDPERGRALFTAQRCAACHVDLKPARHATQAAHAANSPTSPLAAPDLVAGTDLAHGCVGGRPPTNLAPRHGGPRYELTDEQQAALAKFLQTDRHSLSQRCDAEAAERMIERLSCTACHARDNTLPVLRAVIAEGSGRVPDPLPSLTWTGEKLRADWVVEFLSRPLDRPIRPWLKGARMPRFRTEAAGLARGLAHQHGLSSESTVHVEYDAKLAELGRQLSLASGLDCRQCHGVGKAEPSGDAQTQIALGPNFSDIRQRLHYDFYRRFVLDPAAFRPHNQNATSRAGRCLHQSDRHSPRECQPAVRRPLAIHPVL